MTTIKLIQKTITNFSCNLRVKRTQDRIQRAETRWLSHRTEHYLRPFTPDSTVCEKKHEDFEKFSNKFSYVDGLFHRLPVTLLISSFYTLHVNFASGHYYANQLSVFSACTGDCITDAFRKESRFVFHRMDCERRKNDSFWSIWIRESAQAKGPSTNI